MRPVIAVIAVLIVQAFAIHDSDRHSRGATTEELMRRDTSKASRSAPSQDHLEEDSVNDPEELLLREAPYQALRERLSAAKASKDFEAFQAALKEGEDQGLDHSELQAFKDSFDEPEETADLTAEALLENEHRAFLEDEHQLYDSTFDPAAHSSFDYGAPAGPVSSSENALPPVSSAKEEENIEKIISDEIEKDEKDDKDKKTHINSIDYTGCIIPQWNDGDWICAEAADVPDTQIYDDAQSRTRKKLRQGDVCSVQCPDPRYWQKPSPASLVCKSGRWRDEATRINVKKIKCETSGRWVFFFGFSVFGLPLCCGCCGLFLCLKMRRKAPLPAADPAAPAAEAPAATEAAS